MKKIFFVVSFSFFWISCRSLPAVSLKDCDVLNTCISEIRKENGVKSMVIAKYFLDWVPAYNFEFPINELPKSDSERLARIENKHDLIDPYPMLYVFAFPFT